LPSSVEHIDPTGLYSDSSDDSDHVPDDSPPDDVGANNADEVMRRAHFRALAEAQVRETYADANLDPQAFKQYVEELFQQLLSDDDQSRDPGPSPLDLIADREGGDSHFNAFSTIFEESRVLEHMDPDMWQGTKAFYRINPPDPSAPVWIVRLKRSIYPYQLQGAYFMLLRWADFEGALLQDEQGLGKTTTAIVFAATFGWLAYLWDSYYRNKTAHLPTTRQFGERCPFAQLNMLPIACPCEYTFPSLVKRKLARIAVIRGFQAFIVPPPVLTNWVREFQEVVDFQFRGSRTLGPFMEPVFDLRVAHEIGARYDLAFTPTLAHRLLTDSTGRGAERASKYFVLTSSKSIPTRMLQPIKDAWARKSRETNEAVPRLQYGCCTCFIDEMHTFRNPGLITDFLHNLGDRKPEPEFVDTPLYKGALFLLSGTPWERGPADMSIWMSWYRDRWAYILDEFADGRHWLDDTADRDKRCSFSSIQAMHTGITTRSDKLLKTDSGAGDELRQLARDLLDFFTIFSIRRTAHTKWYNGQTLLALPPLNVRYTVVEPVSDAITARLNRAHDEKMREIQASYQERLARWRLFGRRLKRPMPQITDVATMGMHGMRPLVSIPEFEALVEEKVLGGYTQAANPELFTTSSLNALKPYASRMRQSSSRVQLILDRVRSICCGPTVAVRREDDSVHQGTAKLVVLTAYPLVALATYIIIRRHIKSLDLRRPDGEPLRADYVLGHSTRKERDRILGGFNELLRRNNAGDFVCDARGTPQLDQPNGADIIISTIGVLGLGVNLQRSAYEIIMEPQLQHSATAQAVKRVHRLGQQHPTTVEILTSQMVQAERVVQDRRLLRERFAAMVQEAKVNLDELATDDSDDGM
jgi:hypothetical protein